MPSTEAGADVRAGWVTKEIHSNLAVAIVALPLAVGFGITATGSSEGALVGL